ncbi:MAG: hypothetical protein IJ634_06930 [Bacteroidales bacterium]|nr:hypothetical protein [Bacteroidales bacterium]
MNRTLYIVLASVALALSLVSCSAKVDDLTSSVMDMYQHYADRSENLTVAVIGDYERGDRTYNAVMFRAEDDEQWEWLKEEFGVVAPEDILDASDTLAGKPHGVIISPATIPFEVKMGGQKAVRRYVDSVSQVLMHDVLGDSARLAADPMVVFGADRMGDSALSRKMARQRAIDRFSRMHGDAGYILRADMPHRTLWLFFYAGDEEHAQLVRSLNPPKPKQKENI